MSGYHLEKIKPVPSTQLILVGMFLAAPAIALANSASKPMGHTAPLLPTPPSMGAPAPTGPAMGAAINPAAVSYYSCKVSFSARNIPYSAKFSRGLSFTDFVG